LITNFPECIWCDVKIENENTLIGICYRCPGSEKLTDEAMFEMTNKAKLENFNGGH